MTVDRVILSGCPCAIRELVLPCLCRAAAVEIMAREFGEIKVPIDPEATFSARQKGWQNPIFLANGMIYSRKEVPGRDLLEARGWDKFR